MTRASNTYLNHPSVGLNDVTEETRAAALTRAESQRVDTTADHVLQNSVGEPVVARDSSTFVHDGNVSSTVAGQAEFTTTNVLGLRLGLNEFKCQSPSRKERKDHVTSQHLREQQICRQTRSDCWRA